MKNPLALIVEDDASLAEIFAMAVEGAKFETEIIPDGNKALIRLAAIVPDLVVLDLHLPYVSGADILQYIHTDERLAKTRVIVVTADPFRAKSLRSRADLILIKPIGFNQLRDLATRLRPSHPATP